MEAIIVIAGLCLVFLPVFFLIKYLFEHIRKKTKFDMHLEEVKNSKGKMGVLIAYFEKMFLAINIISLGVFMSSYFSNKNSFEVFIVSFILFVIFRYFDSK